MKRTSRLFRRTLPALLPLLTVALLAGCSDDPSGPDTDSIVAFFTGVSSSDGSVTASQQSGAPPAASGGPVVSATSGGTVINGGASITTVTGDTPFRHVIIAVEEIDGYYQLTFASDQDTARVVITLGSELPENTFTILYGVMTQGGAVSSYVTNNVSVASAGTGELQVSVTWDAASDVDLHLVEPGGEEIYYGNTTSDAGGELDLDSNAGCSIDNVNNENITYASAPPVGEYIVRVDYWSECSVSETNYVVTVNIPGQQQQTFNGTFTGTGNYGGEGDGVEITRFTISAAGLSFR